MKNEDKHYNSIKNEDKLLLNQQYGTIDNPLNVTHPLTKQENSMDFDAKTQPFDLWKGIFYMFISCLFKSVFTILTKYLLKNIPDLSSYQLLTYRTYFMLWMSIVLVFIMRRNILSENFIKKDKILLVITRTVLAIFSMSLIVYAMKRINISDVYSVYYIYPGFILILSYFFLQNEKFKLFDYCCMFFCFIGVVLIIKPTFIFGSNGNSTNLSYYALVILASFIKAVEDVLVRNVGNNADPMIFPILYSIFGMFIFPLPMIMFDSIFPMFKLMDVLILFLIAVCTFFYQYFMAVGIQNENAGRVAMVNYVQIALMYGCDLIMFDKKLKFYDLIGTLIIFGFNFTNGLKKTIERYRQLIRYKESLRN